MKNKHDAMRGLLEELRHARPLLLYGAAWIAQIEATLAMPDDPCVADARCWREVQDRFDMAKTSASERILEGLGYRDADPCEALATTVERALRAEGATKRVPR